MGWGEIIKNWIEIKEHEVSGALVDGSHWTKIIEPLENNWGDHFYWTRIEAGFYLEVICYLQKILINV